MSSHRAHVAYPTPPSTSTTGGGHRRAGDNSPYATMSPLVIPDLSSTSGSPPASGVVQPNVMHYPSLSTSSASSRASSQPYIRTSPLGRAVIPLLPGGSVGRPSETSIPSNAHGSGGPHALVNVTTAAPERRRAHESSASFQPVIPPRHHPASPFSSWCTSHKSSSRSRKPQHIRSTPCQLLSNVFSSNSVGGTHRIVDPPSLHHELLHKARFNNTDGSTTRFACLRWDMRFPPSHSFGRDRCRYSVLHHNRASAPVLTLSRPDYYANAFTIQPSTQLLKMKSSDDTVQRLLNVSPLVIKWERDPVLTVQELLGKLFGYLNTPLSSVERRRLVHPADEVHLQRTCARRVHDVEMAALRYGQSLPKNLAETYRIDLLGVNHGFYGFELKYEKTKADLVLSIRGYETNVAITRSND